MDPVLPTIEEETKRRRRRPLFRHARVPVRMLVPNFITLLGLCAGLTSIRMGIEHRYDLALAAIVFAAALDGIDGRIARALKASSRFGAELDSLADFVNFGVAPAFLVFNWGIKDLSSIGWICVMIFAVCSGLRLARFNAALDDEKPKWQSNYFVGMPTPAAAIVVMLPVYLSHMGADWLLTPLMLKFVMLYVLFIAFMMVSTIPTYSGKLLGERVGREWVLPLFVLAAAFVATLFSYPYETLALSTLVYLALIPVSWRRFQAKASEHSATLVEAAATPAPSTSASGAPVAAAADAPAPSASSSEEATGARVFPLRPGSDTNTR